MSRKFSCILYGGDYNPDQWDENIWKEDIGLMKIFRVNTVTLPVFSWASLQSSEDVFNFGWLDKVLDLLHKNNIFVIMATPTAAVPAWMSKKYPEMLFTDVKGRRHRHGGRANFCPNNLDYRRLSGLITEKMALRYKNYPGIILWHINNEYGTYCYCDICANAFRIWLKKRYKNLEELNRCWYTNFWGHTYYSWEEIEPPSHLTELLANRLGNRDGTNFQSIAIDYNRFMSESLLDCYRNEADIIKRYFPEVPVTTNFMGTFKLLDYFKWGKYLDVISWNNYPTNKDQTSNIAMRHDLMRGLKGGKSFVLMEQTPNQQNWQPYNALKRPGMMRLLSYQTISHGGDAILFFQWRQPRGACEKFHAAMIPHAGHENTRISRELIKLGEELIKLGDKIIDSHIISRAAIIFDWPNWWAMEYSSGPSIDLEYADQIAKYYKAFYDLNIAVDMISPYDDLLKYDVVVAPVFYMVEEGTVKNIEKFIYSGGTFITTFFSGVVDENDLVILGGYPGAFRKILGLWVEETDALYPDASNKIIMKDKFAELKKEYDCRLICDVMHTEGAKTIAVFGKDYYKGYPAVTENIYGKGKAVYIATEPEDAFVKGLVSHYCNEKRIYPILKPREGLEVTQRVKNDKAFTFLINYNSKKVNVKLPEGKFKSLLDGKIVSDKLIVPSKEVYILENL